ncbi:MAG: M23 family metallopeptidase [Acidobacteriaceae bacterium]|nr:M23 family metallopeptidase [Acidobacteriaceae bacterium]MBV9937185.1 M23 family metallopeptidase [Acidobacteriaceae bacterium]
MPELFARFRSLLSTLTFFVNPLLFFQIMLQGIGQVSLCLRAAGLRKSIPGVLVKLPFKDECYVARGGTDQATSHSWQVIPQRYALDLVKISDLGVSSRPSGQVPDKYFIYGAPVLAPLNGVIIAAVDRYPDRKTESRIWLGLTTVDLRGNYCVIQNAPNIYCMLAHLRRGSLLVRVGQEVRSGEPIAKVGNSGYSTEPHLHLQVQTSQSFYSSIGLPIAFDSVQIRQADDQANNSERQSPQRGDIIRPQEFPYSTNRIPAESQPLEWVDFAASTLLLVFNALIGAAYYYVLYTVLAWLSHRWKV